MKSDKELFAKLLAMLHIGSLQQMGLIENPVTGERKKDYETARETIDMIDMLSRRMDLTAAEKQSAENLATDLRIKFIALKELKVGDEE